MALVSSGSVAPSYPRVQNTSSARSSASSTSNCRVRPEGTVYLLKKILSPLVRHGRLPRLQLYRTVQRNQVRRSLCRAPSSLQRREDRKPLSLSRRGEELPIRAAK